jgi:hypothetical protein
MTEHFAKERIGLWQVVRGMLAGERLISFRVAAGSEQTVADGLRVHVGKLFFGEVVE